MRTPYAVSFMLVLLLLGTYWFTHVEAKCSLPLPYRIGELDERFDLTAEEARIALMEAEAVWENATGKNLFRYDENAEFTVNFIFDERQALTEAEKDLRERLDASEDINTAIDETYATLVAEYNELNIQYKDRVQEYEQKLNAYNAEVERYNSSGGAPPEVYEKLAREKASLDQEQRGINELASELNALVREINRIGEKGNQLVDIHNHHVEVYNDTFGEEREFTQGDYHRDTINIYTFSDRTELLLVLAHELGHAISLDHVENEESIMYFLMGGQGEDPTPTTEDLAEYELVCGEESAYGTLQEWKSQVITWLTEQSIL